MGHRLHMPRLLLRPMQQADAALYIRLYSDDAVMRCVADPLSLQMAGRAFKLALAQARRLPPHAHYWICRPHQHDEDIGLLALMHDRDRSGLAEVGVLLLPQAQGQGYATEAIAALADHALSEPASGLGLQRLWTRHARDNLAAAGLMQALGFHSDESSRLGELRWSLRREDWPTSARRVRGFSMAGQILSGD